MYYLASSVLLFSLTYSTLANPTPASEPAIMTLNLAGPGTFTLFLNNPAPSPAPALASAPAATTTITTAIAGVSTTVTASEFIYKASLFSSYSSKTNTNSEVQSVVSALATARPETIKVELGSNPLDGSVSTLTVTRLLSMPEDAKLVIASVASVVASIQTVIVTSGNGAAETGIPRAMAGMAGVLGAAALMF
jgi:hypothetical protein